MDAVRDWLPFPAAGEAVGAEVLVNAARAQDAMLQGGVFEELVRQYLAARGELERYVTWLRHSAFPLLILHAAAREAVTALLEAWQALTTAATEAPPGDSLVIRATLLSVDTVLGSPLVARSSGVSLALSTLSLWIPCCGLPTRLLKRWVRKTPVGEWHGPLTVPCQRIACSGPRRRPCSFPAAIRSLNTSVYSPDTILLPRAGTASHRSAGPSWGSIPSHSSP